MLKHQPTFNESFCSDAKRDDADYVLYINPSLSEAEQQAFFVAAMLVEQFTLASCILVVDYISIQLAFAKGSLHIIHAPQ